VEGRFTQCRPYDPPTGYEQVRTMAAPGSSMMSKPDVGQDMFPLYVTCVKCRSMVGYGDTDAHTSYHTAVGH
jgi:hypothetical protein